MQFDNGVAKVQTRLFLDDLSYHLQEKYRLIKADFSTVESNGTQALQWYMNDCFYMLQGEQKILFKITKTALSPDGIALIVYMEGEKPLANGVPLKINNTLLFDVFKKQENVLRLFHSQDEFQKLSFTLEKPMH